MSKIYQPRAWNKRTGETWEVCRTFYDTESWIVHKKIADDKYIIAEWNFADCEELKCTGKTDKTGALIYEGADIEFTFYGQPRRGIVEFDNKYLRYRINCPNVKDIGGVKYSFGFMIGDIKIIGSKFTEPERKMEDVK